jgi:hypothetical protein
VETTAQGGLAVWGLLHRAAWPCGDDCTGRPGRVGMTAQGGLAVWGRLHRAAWLCGGDCTGRPVRVGTTAQGNRNYSAILATLQINSYAFRRINRTAFHMSVT